MRRALDMEIGVVLDGGRVLDVGAIFARAPRRDGSLCRKCQKEPAVKLKGKKKSRSWVLHILSDLSDLENMAIGRHGAHKSEEESGKTRAHILSDAMGTIPYKFACRTASCQPQLRQQSHWRRYRCASARTTRGSRVPGAVIVPETDGVGDIRWY